MSTDKYVYVHPVFNMSPLMEENIGFMFHDTVTQIGFW